MLSFQFSGETKIETKLFHECIVLSYYGQKGWLIAFINGVNIA